MAPSTLTDYERRRLENIRRNDEMMAALLLRRKAADLSSAAASVKRPKTTTDSADKKKNKKPRPFPLQSSPVVVRRSLRNRGLPPDQPQASDRQHHLHTPLADLPPVSEPTKGPLLINQAFLSGPNASDRRLLDVILEASSERRLDLGKGEGGELLDPRKDLVLRPENVQKVVGHRVLAVRFLPSADRTVVMAGDKLGHVGFWDVDVAEEDSDGVYVYHPHSSPVSGISVHPFCPTKIFTCSYDGYIRLMDIQKGTFNMIYSAECEIYSICQSLDHEGVIYLGEGPGELKLWDERTGKISNTWNLHQNRINTIDIHPKNTHLMATSSSDGLACLWDLRYIKKDGAKLKTIQHRKAVHSAYFSPDGNCLATTSIDDRVGILSGVHFDDLTMITHNNKTGRWLSTFRAIWGWDDSFLFLGNMRRAVDVISTTQKTTTTLESEHMTSIPCRFDAHPSKTGYLACATAGGKIFLWEKL